MTMVDGAPQSQFTSALREALAAPGARSWAIRSGDDLVGMFVFEPIYRSWELVDGALHMALARGERGKGIMQRALRQVIGQLFAEIPSLLRVTGWVLSNYTPSRKVADGVGMKWEGTIRSAVRVAGEVRDIALYGMTRQDYEALAQ